MFGFVIQILIINAPIRLVVLYLSIAGSMIFEELLPGWEGSAPVSRRTKPVGMGVTFLGAAVFVGGGILLARGGLDWMSWKMT
jgi:hypothetical protein